MSVHIYFKRHCFRLVGTRLGQSSVWKLFVLAFKSFDGGKRLLTNPYRLKVIQSLIYLVLDVSKIEVVNSKWWLVKKSWYRVG